MHELTLKPGKHEYFEVFPAGLMNYCLDYTSFSACSVYDIATKAIPFDALVWIFNHEGEHSTEEEIVKSVNDVISQCSEYTIILVDAEPSGYGFSQDKYTFNNEPGKIQLTNEMLYDETSRQGKILAENGFICINDYIGYSFSKSYVYGNAAGRTLREVLNGLLI